MGATRRIKAQNNLTDLEAGIGLRNDFNSDTNAAIRERCPWVPAPRCPIITEKYRTFDGSCNNPRDSNFGRTGTPFQRILLPEYARGTLDLPRRSSVDNTQLPSARTISNALSEFLDWLEEKDDVFFVTGTQALLWMTDPKPLSQINEVESWRCKTEEELPPPPCPSPNSCSLVHRENGVNSARYMTTCRTCPSRYPWLGNYRGRDTEEVDVYEKYEE